MDPNNPTLRIIGVFAQRYGIMVYFFSRKRYGVMGALKKAL